MAFELCNIPASFQNYLNIIYIEKLNIFIVVYLDDIQIYIKDLGSAYINTVCQILDKLKKYAFFIQLKKCCFYENKVRFFDYIFSAYKVSIEDEKIEEVRIQLKSMLICNIQIFIKFVNFYQKFIKSFNQIATPLFLMLRTIINQDSNP